VEILKKENFSKNKDKPDPSEIISLIKIPTKFEFDCIYFANMNFLDVSRFTEKIKFVIANSLVYNKINKETSVQYEKNFRQKPNFDLEYMKIYSEESLRMQFKLLDELGLEAMFIPYFKEKFLSSRYFTKKNTETLSKMYASLENPLPKRKQVTKRRDHYIFILVMYLHIHKDHSKNQACKRMSEHLDIHYPTIRKIFWDIHKTCNLNEDSNKEEVKTMLVDMMIKYSLPGIVLKTWDELKQKIDQEANQ